MTRNLRWKAALIFGVIFVCLFGLLCFRKGTDGGTQFAFPTNTDELRRNLGDRINLGLDLRGGMHLILQVQVAEAVNSESDQVAERLRTLLREEGIGFGSIRKPDPTHIQIAGIPAEQLGQARDFLQVNYTSPSTVGGGAYALGSLPTEQSGFVLEMTPSLQVQVRQEALRNSIQTIRQRIDALGVSEPTIAEHGRGEWEILVQLPGVDDPARVKSILQSTAMLEIKLVEDGPFGKIRPREAIGRPGLLPRT